MSGGPSEDGVQVGRAAPAFELRDDAGRAVRLSDLRGRPVVLFFYPEADTPACTKQACGYRDEHAGLAAMGAVVLGVSPDPREKLAAFRAKFGLPYRLLSDPERKVAAAYGAHGEKTLYGRKVVGIIRSSVLVDAEGRVAGVFRNVRSEGNARRMREQLAKTGATV